MVSHSEASPSNVPSLSFVVCGATAIGNKSSMQAIVAASNETKLTTTWTLEQPALAKLLAGSVERCELAAVVTARSPQRLRSELSNLQLGIESLTGHSVSVVAGDPQQLRARASLLADLGVGAILSVVATEEQGKPPRQLPCGLWQLEPSVALPRPRRRWSLLPTRRPSLKQLLGSGTGATHLVAIDLSLATSREVQQFTDLLHEAAQAAREQTAKVVSLSQLSRQLSHQHEIKPQRSILRRAA